MITPTLSTIAKEIAAAAIARGELIPGPPPSCLRCYRPAIGSGPFPKLCLRHAAIREAKTARLAAIQGGRTPAALIPPAIPLRSSLPASAGYSGTNP